MVKDNNDLFVLDPTILTECEIIKKGKLICFDGKYKVDRKMFIKVLNDSISPEHIYNIKTTIDKTMLLECYNSALEICKQKNKLFEQFYYENEVNYQEIRKLVIKRKRYL